MGGRLVEMLTGDGGKRCSHSSAITFQGGGDKERRAATLTDKCLLMLKSFKWIYVRGDAFNLELRKQTNNKKSIHFCLGIVATDLPAWVVRKPSP